MVRLPVTLDPGGRPAVLEIGREFLAAAAGRGGPIGIELTLAELSGLGAGSVVELDRDKSPGVCIALNGRRTGSGELLEVEGRRGVRIVSWSVQP